MANRIKGITVEIGGDTTGLQKALSGVNSQIHNTQNQLKEVQNELKFNPTSTELLQQKQRLLAEAVSETREKLSKLKEVEKQVQEQFKHGDIGKEQYEAFQREIIATEGKLKSLERQAAQSNATLAKIGAVSSAISAKTGEFAASSKGISMAAGSALVAIGGMGLKAASAADDLNTLSKQTGLTTETLQQAQYAADRIDVSYETFTGSINKMVGKLRTNEQGFNDFGIATRNAAGDMLSTEEIFFGAADALSKMTNETERDIAAQELFGKSAAELAGIIDDGGAAFRELGQQAKDAGLIMDQETLDSLNAVNDKIDTLKANLKGSLAKSGAAALEALTPVLDKVAESINKVLEFVANLSPETITMIAMVLAVVAAISPVAGIISKIAGAISAVIPIISAINAVIAANPVVLIIAGIVAAVTALTIVVVKHWDDIKAIFNNIKEKIKEVVDNVKDKFNEVKTFLKNLPQEALQWGKDLIQNFINGITAKAQALIDKVKGVAQTVKDFLGFSEPKLGPLSNFHTYAPDMMKLFAQGIKDNAHLITGAFAESIAMSPIALQTAGTVQQVFAAPAVASNVGGTVNIYPRTMSSAEMDYAVKKANKDLGGRL